MPSVLPHNLSAGSAWGSGGAAFDVVSEHSADAIAHAVDRVWPTPCERFLDIATGTGWAARHLAARGAVVTGIDIGDGMIEAAKRLGPGITFQVGDAEALEFDEGAFDGVTSTFGVMFVARPGRSGRNRAGYTQGRSPRSRNMAAGRPSRRPLQIDADFHARAPSRTATISL